MTRIVVPRASGVLSALGLAAADRRRDETRTVMLHGDGLTAEALREAAAGAGEVAWDVRYRGQSFELTLRGVEPEPGAIAEAFAAAHEERYGYRDPDGEIEVVTVRRTDREPGPQIDWTAPGGAGRAARSAVVALPEATLVIPEGWSGRVDDAGTILLERGA